MRPEIRVVDQAVGIDDTDYTYIAEVQSFGHHLSADQYIVNALVKCIQYAIKAMFSPCRIQIQATDTRFGKQRLQLFLYFFGAKPFTLDMCGSAGGTHL